VKIKIPFFKGRTKAPSFDLSDPRVMQILLNNQAKLIRPFAQHPAVYAPVQTKARNIGQVPLRLYRIGEDEPDERTPLNQLFMGNRQNPGSLFFEGICIQLDLYGQAFLLVDDDETRGGIPKTLNLAMSANVSPVITNGVLMGWRYDNRTYPLERVIQIKYFNPYDTVHGLAPLTCLMLGVDTDYNAMLYNKKYFENDGTPGIVYSTDQMLNDQQYTRLKAEIIDKHAGVGNSHKGMILANGLKPSMHRQLNKDLQFLEGRKFTIAETCMVFGVPKEAVQMYEDINYATATTSNRSFWEKTLMPMADMITDAINYLFLNNLGYTAKFDFKGISALTQPIAEMAGAVSQYFNMGIPLEQLNDMFNLGIIPFDGWDKPFNGRGEIPIPPEVRTAKEKQFVKPAAMVEGMRKAAWIKLNDKVIPIKGKMAKQLRGYFRSGNQKLLNRLMGTKAVKQITEDDIDSIIAVLYDDERLKSIMTPEIEGAIRTGASTIQMIGDFDVKTMLAQRLEKLTEINETTRKLLSEKLHDTLAEALAEGLTESERTQRLISAAEAVGEQNLKRARTIARTEAHGSFSAGREESAKQFGATHKRWVADVFSPVTRDTHRSIHGERVKITDRFSNGLEYPLDPAGAPEESINCRCVSVYDFEDEEQTNE
jgi:HK97 family phage portal protein